ncbi:MULTISPECIES: DUF177 domain-containing protein [unclassified Salipiger]|uniref:YceD family protein n=1 Tax=unclassified Salipiger TaxID=2640570 RepID=UPI0013BD80F4|nr:MULTISPECIES: DUF177 domain-containing protein [unclassified Salipiger]NDV51872.1 DUF177 domain-containing protein [Salipiger sp. PrR003]NDW31045.1 DUF177 domain-containing protein [Salipiger sp. PrR007]
MDRGGNPARLRVSTLRRDVATDFDIRPEAEERSALAKDLGLLGLRKARLAGKLTPEAGGAYRLTADLGATVVQPCVVTLDPVTTRIDEEISLLFRPAQQIADPDPGSEVEVPEDEEEPLPDVIDLRRILSEALSLALPPYPRSQAALEMAEAAPDAPEEDPSESRPNPFAGLAGLRDRLSKDEKEED